MEPRKIQSKKRYLAAFIIGTIAFILIFAVSNTLLYFQFQRITGLQEVVSYEIFQEKLKYSLFQEDICLETSYKAISASLGFQGKVIDDLEKEFGKEDEKVIFRKKFYSLIELEHLEFVNILNRQCNKQISTILFFYSNTAADIKASEEVGNLLGVVSSKNQELVIYSFDINLESDLVDKLKQKYLITKSPSIIINEEILLMNPRSLEEIETYL